MAAAIELPKGVKPGKARVSLDWPEGLRRLPAEFGIKTTDIGFEESDQIRLVAQAKAGNEKAHAIIQTTREVLLELMSRDIEERQVEASNGKKVYFDHSGEATTLKYSTHVFDDNGRAIEHLPALETRSRWGIRAGRETLTAPGAPMPQPGHMKIKVEEHFDDLFPRLVFRSNTPDTKYVHTSDSRDAFLAAHKQAVSDDGQLRTMLLSWLPAFLKKPQSKWDGQS